MTGRGKEEKLKLEGNFFLKMGNEFSTKREQGMKTDGEKFTLTGRWKEYGGENNLLIRKLN